MIVSDSSPLIYYSRIGRLHILKELYELIYIPRTVVKETVEEAAGKTGVSHIKEALMQGWLRVEEAPSLINYRDEGIEPADAEVISLAMSKSLPLLTNDRALARVATVHGVKITWLTSTVVEAVRRGVLTRDQGQQHLIELIKAGLRVRSEVLARIIELLIKAERAE